MKKSKLSNPQSPSHTSPASSTGNPQPNSSHTTPSTLAQQGYTKKQGCGCGKK